MVDGTPKKKKDTLNPPKLFSLSKLQSYLGKKFKLSMDETLTTVQKLYEDGYVTYPRTNSEYLATAEKGKVRKILENCAALGYPVVFKDKKTIFYTATKVGKNRNLELFSNIIKVVPPYSSNFILGSTNLYKISHTKFINIINAAKNTVVPIIML